MCGGGEAAFLSITLAILFVTLSSDSWRIKYAWSVESARYLAVVVPEFN